MEWDRLVRETALQSGCSREYTEEIVDAFFDAVMDGMRTDRLVMLRPDLGYFEMRPAETGRRERSPARRAPVFKKSGQLKALLRGMSGE